MIVAVSFFFVGKSDSLAKTAQQATAELSKEGDGETYYQLQAPKTFQVKSESEERADDPRLGRLFTAEIESLQNKVSRFWHQVLPKFEKIYYKNIEVVD